MPEKVKDLQLDRAAPDFSVACMQFESGVVARLTCSILAPHDHQLRIVGDNGVLSTQDCWKFRSPVTIRRMINFRRRQFLSPWGRKYPLVGGTQKNIAVKGGVQVDWCRGVADLAQAIRDVRKPRLAPDFCLHVNELVLGIHNAFQGPGVIPITTDFEPVDPMPWAKP
jgi:hypothetical protein